MIIALLFLPLVLLIITIGLPLLCFLLAVAAMFFISYQRIVGISTECRVVFGQEATCRYNRPPMKVPDMNKPSKLQSGARTRRAAPFTKPPRRSVSPASPSSALWTIPECPSVASCSSDESWNDRRKVELYDMLVPLQRLQDGVAYARR